MIESCFSYDLLPNIDLQAYGEWSRKTIAHIIDQPGVIEFRANRNMMGSPQMRATTVWQSLSDWTRFVEGGGWQNMQTELRNFGTNFHMELWGPSPVAREPVRPAK